MTRRTILMTLGVVTALAPFLGLPYAWLMVLMPVIGSAVFVVAFLIPPPEEPLERVETVHHHEAAS